MSTTRCLRAGLFALVAVCFAGCHRDVDLPALSEAKISLIGSQFFDAKAFSSDRALVIGYGGKVLETTDAGRTWRIVSTPTDRALYRIRFADDQHGWIAGQDGVILVSADGGRTWAAQHSGTSMYLFSLHAFSPTHVMAVGDQSAIVETMDGGVTWTSRTLQLTEDEKLSEELKRLFPDPIFYDVQFASPLVGWIVGEAGTLLRTTDGGTTWTSHGTSLIGKEIVDVLALPTLFGVHFVDEHEGIAAGINGTIVRTHDGGRHWAVERIDEQVEVLDSLYAPFLSADGTGWVVGSGGEVLKIEPGASAWKRAALGMHLFTWLRGIGFFDRDHGWIVGGLGTILRTKDGGRTWTPSVA